MNIKIDVPTSPALTERQVVMLSVRDDRRLRAYSRKSGVPVSTMLRQIVQQVLDNAKVK